MPWITTKEGKHINTDWFDKEANEKDRQIALNRIEGSDYNEFSKVRIKQSKSLVRLNSKVLDITKNTVTELNAKYPKIARFLEDSHCKFEAIGDDKYGIMSAVTSISNGNVSISNFVFNSANDVLASETSMYNYCARHCGEFFMECAPDKYTSYLIAHEYGHIVQNYILNRDYNWTKFTTSKQLQDFYTTATREMAVQLIATAKSHGIRLDDSKLSEYAYKKLGQKVYTDLFAESFANMVCGKSNCWGDAMQIFLKEKKV